MKRIVSAEQINPNFPETGMIQPMYAVCDVEDIEELNRNGEIEEGHLITGWGTYNAIVTYEENGVKSYYLAEVE